MGWWRRTAVIVWSLVVAAGVGRAALYHLPRHCGCYDVFADGGRHWLAGEPVYDLDHPDSLTVFRYSPLVAAGCAPLALLSAPAGSAVLRLFGFTLLLTGLTWWGRTVLPDGERRAKWWVLVAAAGGAALLDVQLTMPMVGLMLIAAAAFSAGRFNIAAAALSLAVCLKAYPVALAMLFVLIAPRRFGPRFVVAMAVALAAPFALQSPAYVAGQYHDWLAGGLNARYVDGWFQDAMFLWQRVVGPIERSTFTLASVIAGAVVGLIVMLRRRDLSFQEQVVAAFGLASAWMMAFGPATEATTYVLLAPAAALAAVNRRGLMAFALLALSQAQLLFPLGRPLQKIGAQPLAALLLMGVYATRTTSKSHGSNGSNVSYERAAA